MKIKNITTALGALFLMLIGFSCDDKFLDKNPLDQISSETFWKSKADADMALAGCYARLRDGFLGYQGPYLDCLSDNASAAVAYFAFFDVQKGILSPNTAASFFNMFYNYPYQGISTFNFFLENIDRVTAMTDSERNVYKGEVRFLRALTYFQLVQSFGGVILYDKLPENAADSKRAKSSKEEVLSFIQEDLDFAIANLPDDVYSGHAIKGSSMALKSRVLMYQQKWAEAAALSGEIINSGIFSLSDNYQEMFNEAGQDGNPEIMFSTRYLSPNSAHDDGEGMDVIFGWYGSIWGYQDLVDDYEMTDGQSITESPLFDSNNPYQNRDPRLDMTFKLVPVETWLDASGAEITQQPSVFQTDYQIEKYVDFSHAPFTYARANLSGQDYILIRYAEVLLMYAEAQNEASGPDATVYDALDEVRARPSVALPPVDQAKYNTQELLRDYIRRERRVELALEGHRYWDLKRWNIAHIKLPTMTNYAGSPFVFEQHHYLFPFQQFELDNNPQLEQNPGY